MNLKWNALGALFILSAFVLIHSRIETFSLGIGLSWTFSKIAPYLLEFIVVVLLSTLLSKLISGSLVRQKFILVASILLFSGASFALNPIYEGDFANTFEEIITSSEEINEGLTMVALPGCPYCYERIATLNKLNKFNDELPITVIMLEGDPLAMEEYSNLLPKGVQVLPAKNSKLMSELVSGSFPAFIFKPSESSPILLWNQIGFGSGAMDWLSEKY